MAPRGTRRLRYLPLLCGAAALIAGLETGLARIGIALPASLQLDEWHGALMICGFFGTLISLERAVAIGKWWAYAAPALAAAGALALLLHAPFSASMLFLAAAGMLTLGTATIFLRHPAVFTAILTLAAAAWGVGTLAWLGAKPMADVTGWWLLFLLLTIFGERLELSRLVHVSRNANIAFLLALALIVVGLARGELGSASAPFTGLGLLAATAWLSAHDIARRTVRLAGQTRFSAMCMLAGYGWLGVTGLVLLFAGSGAAFAYDAAVHGITIGFVLSMVFGHALIILPAVTGLRVRYHPALYAPLALLHGAVALRIAADFLGWVDARAASAPLTILALLLFGATVAAAARRPSVPRALRIEPIAKP